MSHNTPIEADTSVVEGTAGEAGGGGGAGSGGFSAVSMSQRLTEFWDAVLTYTIDNGLTLTRVWATSFDRARTSRNTRDCARMQWTVTCWVATLTGTAHRP